MNQDFTQVPASPVIQSDTSSQVSVPAPLQQVPEPSDDVRQMATVNAFLSQATQPPAVEDTLNPAYPTASAKEQQPLTIEHSGEMPPGVQSVEELRSAEIAPEVEKYIEEVREQPTELPKEIVIADQKVVIPTDGFVAQPVIVLPMTQQQFQEDKKAPLNTSRRWLAEWTEKITKMFGGSVMYRDEKAA
jgi:hypothetical protein